MKVWFIMFSICIAQFLKAEVVTENYKITDFLTYSTDEYPELNLIVENTSNDMKDVSIFFNNDFISDDSDCGKFSHKNSYRSKQNVFHEESHSSAILQSHDWLHRQFRISGSGKTFPCRIKFTLAEKGRVVYEGSYFINKINVPLYTNKKTLNFSFKYSVERLNNTDIYLLRVILENQDNVNMKLYVSDLIIPEDCGLKRSYRYNIVNGLDGSQISLAKKSYGVFIVPLEKKKGIDKCEIKIKLDKYSNNLEKPTLQLGNLLIAIDLNKLGIINLF